MGNSKCALILSDFLDYLSVVKGKSDNTLKEYRLDLINFFNFIISKTCAKKRKGKEAEGGLGEWCAEDDSVDFSLPGRRKGGDFR